jgi:hypothetical protein
VILTLGIELELAFSSRLVVLSTKSSNIEYTELVISILGFSSRLGLAPSSSSRIARELASSRLLLWR